MRDFSNSPPAELMNVALVDTIIELLGTDALCPDDILTLVTLYENSALFHRRRGRWYLVSLDVRDRHMSYPEPTLSA